MKSQNEVVVFRQGQTTAEKFHQALASLIDQKYRFVGTITYKNRDGLVREVHVHFFKPGR